MGVIHDISPSQFNNDSFISIAIKNQSMLVEIRPGELEQLYKELGISLGIQSNQFYIGISKNAYKIMTYKKDSTE